MTQGLGLFGKSTSLGFGKAGCGNGMDRLCCQEKGLSVITALENNFIF